MWVSIIIFLSNIIGLYYICSYKDKYIFYKHHFVLDTDHIFYILFILLLASLIVSCTKWYILKNKEYLLSKLWNPFYLSSQIFIFIIQLVLLCISFYYLSGLGTISLKIFMIENHFTSIDESINLSQGYKIVRVYSDEEKILFAIEIIEKSLLAHNSIHTDNNIKEVVLTNEVIEKILHCNTFKEIKLYINSFLNKYFMSNKNSNSILSFSSRTWSHVAYGVFMLIIVIMRIIED